MICVLFSACQQHAFPFSTPIANINTTDNSGHPALLGSCDPKKLEQPPFDTWFVKNYHNYQVDTLAARQLKPLCKGKSFVIFMGTWCGDSQREVPRMLKILRFCQVPASHIRIVMVSDHDSTYKQSPNHEGNGLHIVRVPDLIIFENRRELGRIIESPIISLEKDALAIAGRHPYRPHYAASLQLARIFETDRPDSVRAHLSRIADSLQPRPKSVGELNSLAHALRAEGKPEWADIVIQLNTMLFPAVNGQ